MNIHGVLFDFDGIIADTERLHFQAFQQVLDPLDLGFTWEDYAATYLGFDDRGVFLHVFSLAGQTLEPERMRRLIEDKAAWFEAQAASGGIPLFPGVEALIRAAAAKGPLGLCSGALRGDIVPILKQHGLDAYFNIMVTAEDVAESKPHPASYQLAAQRIQALAGGAQQLPNAAILAIEDTPEGIQSAQGAGLFTVGIGHTFEVEALASADLVFESFAGVTLDRIEKLMNEGK